MPTRSPGTAEGWHLVAAQSINRGKRPYLDFCYPQTPLKRLLECRLDARVRRYLARSARSGRSDDFAGGAADRELRVAPIPGARLEAGGGDHGGLCSSGLGMGWWSNTRAIAQAYGLCLFLIATAFLFTVAAVDRAGPWSAGAAGLAACDAANCSLLTAPVSPVLLVWMLVTNRAGNRWAKLGAFAAGGAVACAPLAWLFAEGPRQAIFNVLHYNLLYRQREWGGAVAHNFGEWFAWVDSPQALILGLLAVAGVLFIRKRSGWGRAQRREFYLCAWLAVALMAHISYATPTFRRYWSAGRAFFLRFWRARASTMWGRGWARRTWPWGRC